MPNIGGKCKKLWKETASTMVKRKSPIMTKPPDLIMIDSFMAEGCSLVTANDIKIAGIIQLTTEGIKRLKN